jgi:ubiquinone/menaquinone biosynthesis C-methylase UbiE
MDENSNLIQDEARESMWWEKLSERHLVDLGKNGARRLSGIYSPIYDQGEIDRFMSDYYGSTQGAQSQVEKFDLTDYYLGLLSEAFEKINFPKEEDSQPIILELGCGFGSATFPLLRLFPNAYLLASDLSVSMLTALKDKLDRENVSERCVLLQLNAEDLDFRADSFDIIVGAALLHHLFHPEKVLEKCAKILKPGGYAIFFEPFENGHSILGLIYKKILHDIRAIFLGLRKWKYFRNSIRTWQSMKIKDKKDSFFKGKDDKWIFTKHYFNTLAEEYDFRQTIIYSLEKSNRPFENLAKTHFEGNNIGNLPGWIWDTIKEYEAFFSDDLKKDLLTEGCVIFRK